MDKIPESKQSSKLRENSCRKCKYFTMYTDGACEPNPGRGGYGVVLLSGGEREELSAGYRLTTSNRMEIMAAIAGLEELKESCIVTLYSDSSYLVNAMTKGWVYLWKSNNWLKKHGKKAKNVDLWKRLLALCKRLEVKFVWLKGHSGNQENERCDLLSYKALEGENLLVDEVYEKNLAVML